MKFDYKITVSGEQSSSSEGQVKMSAPPIDMVDFYTEAVFSVLDQHFNVVLEKKGGFGNPDITVSITNVR